MAVHSRPIVLLTRPRAASERFADGMDGFDVVIAPLMEIAGTGAEVTLNGLRGLILTSENAVPFLPAWSPAPPAPLPAFCVGPRTAEAAGAAGFAAEVLGPDAEGLVKALRTRRPEGPLLHVHGVQTRGEVAGRLRACGLDVRDVAVYDQRALPPGPEFAQAIAQRAQGGHTDHPTLIVPLFSPASATRFAEALGEMPGQMTLLAMSPAVKRALPKRLQDHTTIIPHPTGADMRSAVEGYAMRRNSP